MYVLRLTLYITYIFKCPNIPIRFIKDDFSRKLFHNLRVYHSDEQSVF